MHRALPVGNKVCAARVRKRYEDQRASRLREMKSQTDTAPPKTTSMAHLKNNWKRDEIQNQRHDNIERDNRMMLHKMHEFAKKPEYSVPRSLSLPALRACPGGPAQQREYDRIMQENGKMLGRLRGMKPEIHVRNLEDEYEHSKKYVNIKCEYPPPLLRRKGARQSPARSYLARLPGAAPAPKRGSTAPGLSDNKMDDTLSDMPEVGELRYVVREDRVIDGGTGGLYNVEMATDGSSLAVSVYDSDNDHGLELLLNEDNHRALMYECRDDYTMIAARLRIDGDQLFVAPLDEFNVTQHGGEFHQAQAGEVDDGRRESSAAGMDDEEYSLAQQAAMAAQAGGFVEQQPPGTVWFEPTAEWQEVPPNAVCPGGLEYHYDPQSGKNFARLC